MMPSAGISGCTQAGPKRSQARTLSQGCTGAGGRQRSGPTGGAANGTPLNTARPASSLPRKRPVVVSTVDMGGAYARRPRRVSPHARRPAGHRAAMPAVTGGGPLPRPG